MILGLAAHVVGVIIWVGGLSFATLVLHTNARASFDPATLSSYRYQTFAPIFRWYWAAILVLLGSGLVVTHVAFGGFAVLPIYVRTMMGLGVLSVPISTYCYFAPWRRFGRAIRSGDWVAAEGSFRWARRLIMSLLVLGLAAAIIGATGRYFG